MQQRLKPVRMFIRGIIALLLLGSSQLSLAEQDADALELRRIMQDMGKHMQLITDAISREDWTAIAEPADLIAEHPQPPFSEKLRILSFIGSQVSEFKGFDSGTHEAAKKLGQLAATQDGNSIIDQFTVLQKNCLACHQTFRDSFKEHFYGNH